MASRSPASQCGGGNWAVIVSDPFPSSDSMSLGSVEKFYTLGNLNDVLVGNLPSLIEIIIRHEICIISVEGRQLLSPPLPTTYFGDQTVFKNKTRLAATIAVAATFALPLLAVSSAASAAMIDWKGVTFETQGSGTAEVESGSGDLLLMPTGNSFAVHTNRIPDNGNSPSFINANDTPFITFSYFDTGDASEKIDVAVQDESATGAPRAAAGSLFGASKIGVATYGTGSDRNTNERYIFSDDPRANVKHDVLLGHTADGTLYFGFDGEQRSSDIFKDEGIDFDFNDVTFRARGASGSTIRFTDFAFGDDFSPNAQAVPEPSSLAMLGLGGILLLFFGRTRRSRG